MPRDDLFAARAEQSLDLGGVKVGQSGPHENQRADVYRV